MNFRPTRLAVALLGDRLAVAVQGGSRVEAFVVDAESPVAALRAELDARRLPARTVALGVARSAVSVKQIELPAVAGDTREMVGFELERHLPFPSDDAAFDFVPLPAEAAGERNAAAGQRVLIAAADRRVVDAAMRIAEEARLRPVSLTVAAHNLPALTRLRHDRRVAWVHRAGEAVDLLLLQGDSLLLSRSLPSGEEAAIAEEIERSMAAVRWRDCNAIWISGDEPPGGIAGPLLALGVPVAAPAWTPAAQQRLAGLAEDQRGALQLAVAVLSARGARPLELLPVTMRPRRLTRAQTITLGMAGATALLAILALLAPGWREQRHLKRVNAEIARLEPTVKEVERVARELDRKRKLITTVDALESTGIRPLPVLRDLTELLPNDAWLTTVSLDGKGVEVTGAASAASTLIPLLENSPRLERVEFSSPVTRGRDNKEQFRIRAAWEPGGTGSAPPAAVAAPPPGGAVPPSASGGSAPQRRPLAPGAPRS
ncbi:MAG TPA: PilN domain-containing protein [Methylomirabilota bacterium]|nr:PilN domain-containing protein [Methylomirabilota bacterium]